MLDDGYMQAFGRVAMARKWEDWQIAAIAGVASIILGLGISIPLGWMVYQRYVRGDFSNGRPTVIVIGM